MSSDQLLYELQAALDRARVKQIAAQNECAFAHANYLDSRTLDLLIEARAAANIAHRDAKSLLGIYSSPPRASMNVNVDTSDI